MVHFFQSCTASDTCHYKHYYPFSFFRRSLGQFTFNLVAETVHYMCRTNMNDSLYTIVAYVFLFNNTLPASIQVHIRCLCIKAVTDTVQHGPAKINFNMCKDGSFISYFFLRYRTICLGSEQFQR